ncbi:MAG TPA: hypothetical protein VFZ51_01380 [Woeseiaceae bacterium]
MMQAIDLGLIVEIDMLRVTVVNRSERDLRLWARSNSWGWSMFSLLLARLDSDQWMELTAKPIDWTRNVPHALDVPAGSQLEYELKRGNPGWKDAGAVAGWLSQPVQIRVRLRIPETPEAVAQDVFIGEALTSPSLSMPPHSWFQSTAALDR